MALVRSRSTHSEDLDDGTVIAPGEERSIDVSGDRAQDLLARSLLVILDPDAEPGAPGHSNVAVVARVPYDATPESFVLDLTDVDDPETDERVLGVDGTPKNIATQEELDSVLAMKGEPDGLAELDGDGKVPESQLPDSVGSGSSPVLVPDGLLDDASARPLRIAPWNLAHGQPAVADGDTLFLMDFDDEREVLAQGGRLSRDYGGYLTLAEASKKSLAPGPGWQTAVDEHTGTQPALVFPVDGLCDPTQFSIDFQLLSVGADFTAQASQPANSMLVGLASSVSGASGSIQIYRTGTTTLAAYIVDHAGTVVAGANLVLASGDIPADTWRCVGVTWDNTTLRIRVGSKTATGTAAVSTRPVLSSGDYNGGGLIIGNSSFGAASGPFRVASLRINRYSRTYQGAARGVAGPLLTIDAGTTSTAFKKGLTGHLYQFASWRSSGADVNTSQRQSVVDAAAAAGAKLMRVDHLLDRPSITGTAGSPVYDWSIMDDHMDPAYAAGFEFHFCIDFCPAILAGGGGMNAVPSDFNAYAAMASAMLAHYKARYPGRIKYISFWNEPDLASFWLGTTAQFATLWHTVYAKIATDHPELPRLGTCEEASAPGTMGSGSFTDAVLAKAVAQGVVPAEVWFHTYSTSIADHYKRARDCRALADAYGFTTVPIRNGEFSMSLVEMSQHVGDVDSLALLNPEAISKGPRHAAWTYNLIKEFDRAGLDVAIFTRLGVFDAAILEGTNEMYLGAYTNDNPARPFPVAAMFALLWKHIGGTLISATSNWPGIHTYATIHDDDRIVVSYASHRPWKATEERQISIRWDDLPTEFTWKQWRVDYTAAADGRPVIVSSGDQTNLPLGFNLCACGVGAIEITPT